MATSDFDEWMEAGARRQKRWMTLGSIAVIALVLVILGVQLFASCNFVPAGDQRALTAIRNSGLTDAKLGGADALACSENESSRHFAATNANGERVEGTVCC